MKKPDKWEIKTDRDRAEAFAAATRYTEAMVYATLALEEAVRGVQAELAGWGRVTGSGQQLELELAWPGVADDGGGNLVVYCVRCQDAGCSLCGME